LGDLERPSGGVSREVMVKAEELKEQIKEDIKIKKRD
jgi:hypothetical protein